MMVQMLFNSKPMFSSILVCLLLVLPGGVQAESLPKGLCAEVLESLQEGVSEGILTQEEAQWVYEGCGRFVENQTGAK